MITDGRTAKATDRGNMMNISIIEAAMDERVIGGLIALSEAWEAENSCYGYRKNDRADIEGNRIFLAKDGEEVVGYLFGHAKKAEKPSSVMPEGTEYFEIEELYVKPEHRSMGVGGRLFRYAEEAARRDGIGFLMLGTATKNFRAILHFYIDEMGMEFWSARLFKKLRPEGIE